MKRLGLPAGLPLLLLLAAAGLAQAAPAGWERWGRIESLAGKGCVVLAAPHGTFDAHTDEITREAARRTGYPALLATGFVEHPFGERPRRINVNRPTEGARLRAGEEPSTPRARDVFSEYSRRVKDGLHGRSPALYVEIHGQSQVPEAAEVAVKGFGREDALALKRIWEEERRSAGEEGRLFEDIQVRVEPADAIRYRAAASKRIGAISQVERALHFELPRRMRFEEGPRAAAARLLARVLPRFFAERLGACRAGG